MLHVDLHHDNILQNGNEWLVIDPKGVVGEPAYEVAAFIHNPMPELLTHADAQLLSIIASLALLSSLNYHLSGFFIGALCKQYLHGFGH